MLVDPVPQYPHTTSPTPKSLLTGSPSSLVASTTGKAAYIDYRTSRGQARSSHRGCAARNALCTASAISAAGHNSSSTSSEFPAISLGFTSLDESFAHVTGFFVCLFVCLFGVFCLFVCFGLGFFCFCFLFCFVFVLCFLFAFACLFICLFVL